jgi:hypothetical protein
MQLPLEMRADDDPITKQVSALRIRQPIGDIYLASIDYQLLQKITYFDVRRVLRDQRDVEAYLGIQRPLNESRIESLETYVNFRGRDVSYCSDFGHRRKRMRHI